MRWQAGLVVRTLALVGMGAFLPALAETVVNYRCEAVYLPARGVWVRSVALVHDDQKITDVRIDDVPVYSFNVHGVRVLTALDNERIVFDAEQLSWHSDWRGVMQANGRCEQTP
jgi:hypothetical protein